MEEVGPEGGAERPRWGTLCRLWGKVDQDSNHPHPLVCHIAETAAVAALLWDEVLSPTTHHVIAQSMGLSCHDARTWSLYLVGLHDLGKVSPAFQSKWLPAVPLLKELGYQFRPNVEPVPHGRTTAIALCQILRQSGVATRTANELAKMAGGHHGVFDSARILLEASPRAVGEGLWDITRNFIAHSLGSEVKLSGVPSKHELSGLTLVAGLTTVSDWIASSEKHFPYRTDVKPTCFADLMAECKPKAEAALEKLGWRARLILPEPLDFKQLFGISQPRPLQTECLRVAGGLDSPFLVIVEAPMGDGKTEAAIFLAEHVRIRNGLRGSFIGLPTQATTNQMFGRLVKALSPETSSGVAHVLLLHGHASLSADFDQIRAEADRAFVPSSIESDGAASTHVAAGEWFTWRKRGLLAPYGVGTIDQALMAALQSRHVFVRLLGLSGKVVVIDEVHAYDTYMSALLERLLAWLRSVGTSVIMLSATLPVARRSALMRAFDPACEAASDELAYPSLTVVQRGVSTTSSFAAFTPHKRITLEPVPADASALALWLRDRLAAGGCAAIVCNTVGRAQEIYERCRELVPGHADDGAPVVDLLHSRFPFEERAERENRTLCRFGKPKEARRPAMAILVATQIIEQSLDIDFDVMVSELAPVDLILQRAGRIHRHERGLRPTGDSAVLGLMETPVNADGTPEFRKGSTRVYEEHILLRSWLALHGRSHLSIPEEIRPLVETVYAEPGDPPLQRVLGALWDQTASRLATTRKRHTEEAESRYLPHPDSGGRLDSLTAMGRDDDEDLHPFFRALTRLAERTVTIICLFRDGDDLYLDRDCTRPLSLHGALHGAEVPPILHRSCPVGDWRVVDRLEAIPVPGAWRKSALLRNCRPVVFDSDGCYAVGPWRLRLCSRTGLRVEENPVC